MEKARVVIGANYGDEGKGLVTDYLCSKGAGVVVRFNGGAQAGHTVVTPDGLRHVHHHFGSGTLLGVPTFLSEFFIVNPILFFKELDELHALGVEPAVFADPRCIVTTFADMFINQRREDALGDKRHGSCGVGINETVNRSSIPELCITMADLWNNSPSLTDKLHRIATDYAEYRTGVPIKDPADMIEAFMHGCQKLAGRIDSAGVAQCRDPVFEGAQGLMLDQSLWRMDMKHVTRSNTGMKNVRVLCEKAGIKEIETYYVTRTYLTRHGAGPLPGEDPDMSYPDKTNVQHDYQGKLRFAPLDLVELYKRCETDYGGKGWRLAVTHRDQFDVPLHNDFAISSYGETRNDVMTEGD